MESGLTFGVKAHWFVLAKYCWLVSLSAGLGLGFHYPQKSVSELALILMNLNNRKAAKRAQKIPTDWSCMHIAGDRSDLLHNSMSFCLPPQGTVRRMDREWIEWHFLSPKKCTALPRLLFLRLECVAPLWNLADTADTEKAAASTPHYLGIMPGKPQQVSQSSDTPQTLAFREWKLPFKPVCAVFCTAGVYSRGLEQGSALSGSLLFVQTQDVHQSLGSQLWEGNAGLKPFA